MLGRPAQVRDAQSRQSRGPQPLLVLSSGRIVGEGVQDLLQDLGHRRLEGPPVVVVVVPVDSQCARVHTAGRNVAAPKYEAAVDSSSRSDLAGSCG